MAIKLQSVGSLQKGSYIVIDGVACKVTDTATSRPGKHGHAKVNLMAAGLIDGKKRNLVLPGHDNVEVPIIEKKDAQVLSITNNVASCMDMETYETIELEVNEDIEGVAEGDVILYWQILEDKVAKQIKSKAE
ncbi:MAG: translation initiation factor IF-5A [Candidatus Woesearchaeota archaeon]